mgnify:CR=1 FL=1
MPGSRSLVGSSQPAAVETAGFTDLEGNVDCNFIGRFQKKWLTIYRVHGIILNAFSELLLFKCFAEIPGCGSAWLEHLVWDQGVAGSNPVTPIFIEKKIKKLLTDERI